MELQHEKEGGWRRIRLIGRLDAGSASHVEQDLEEAIRAGDLRVRVNVSGVDYLSSAGIRALVKYYQTFNRLGGAFVVEEPSELVQSIINMTGLRQLLEEPVLAGKALELGSERHTRDFGPLVCTRFALEGHAPLVCECIGAPEKLGGAGVFQAGDGARIVLPRGTCALGVGAFGRDFEDCRPRYGDFLAASGAVAQLPADGSKTPDYVVEEGGLIPEIQCLYGLMLRGGFEHCIRFETNMDEAGTPLSRLVDACFELTGAEQAGFVLLAESAGLIGASLKKPPVPAPPDGGLFAHPGIRDWLSFTPERTLDRALALVVGVATRTDDPCLTPFLRPLGSAPRPAGHFHAAAFTYRALPKGRIPLDETVASLFAEQALLNVLHLLNDTRGIIGAGESLFRRGAVWMGPLSSIRLRGVSA